jgi:hypothetical protein
MAKLHAAQRNAIPSSKFGLPGQRKYPMPDKSHAANAKARASQQEHAGRLSAGQKAEIDAKANRVLGKTGKSMSNMKGRS